MSLFYKLNPLFSFFTVVSFCNLAAVNPNQTETTSPIYPGSELPFSIDIEEADFSLPNGIHSGVTAIHDGKWLLLAGRTNGLHGFDATDNFPPSQQNTTVYVVDPKKKKVYTRSLKDAGSGLSQKQIDSLSVVSPQSYQDGKTLYMTGGYGINTANGTFSTKNALTAIDIPGLMDWVMEPKHSKKAKYYIRQIFDPIFQVTGGYMTKNSDGLTLLIFGQNFEGPYTDSSNGVYLEQIHRFIIDGDTKKLTIKKKETLPETRNPNYRRRDLNVVPIVLKEDWDACQSFLALSGVFTEAGGIWTVPVFITKNGKAYMPNPSDPDTFKQGMNNYASPTICLFSNENRKSYTILLGGLSYGFFQDGTFQKDEDIPFINQVTTIRIDKHKKFKQYLMDAEYPVILSTGSNPGNQLLFGAGAKFMPVKLPDYKNGVIKLDLLKCKRELIGYIVGGIASTLTFTNTRSDSMASSYIFKVYLTKNSKK